MSPSIASVAFFMLLQRAIENGFHKQKIQNECAEFEAEDKGLKENCVWLIFLQCVLYTLYPHDKGCWGSLHPAINNTVWNKS